MAEGTRKNPQEYQREYNDFIYKLRRFLASKDIPMKKLPLFGGEEVDLYLLYKTVTDLGGWLKVTDERKWHEVVNCFNIPPSCLNSAFALRQLYVRYLERYEKLYFLGEEGDDQIFPRLNFCNVGSTSSRTSPVYRDPQKNFERLVLSLQSGLPNEVDFAINICMLLSNVNNSVFNLAKAPAIVDMMLAHVGVFLEDVYGTSELYKEWYKASGKDFLKFWNRILNSDEIKELLPKDDTDATDSEQFCAKEIFNLDIPAAHADFELQRVLQVCTILHNFSFDKTDAAVLSSHPVCMRFLLFCLHSNIGSLKKLATDTMTNLADKMVLEPLESLNSQLFFFMVDRYVCDSDRHNRICGMNILKKICMVEENQDSVCKAIDIAAYKALVKVLVLEDVQLLVSSLETLYQLTTLGQVPCDHMVTVERSIEILVALLSVCVEAYGAEVLSMVKVIDNYRGLVPGMVASKHSPAKGVVNNPEQVHRADTEAEALAQHWLRVSYNVDPANTILQRDLYADYLTSCGKLGTGGILNSSSFYRILKFMFPDIQVVKLNTGQQQLYGLVGIRKKVALEQVYGQTVKTPRQLSCTTPAPPLRVTSPTARTASLSTGMETNFVKVGHLSRTPTPEPLQRMTLRQCDGQALSISSGLSMTTPSSTLPVKRRDVIVPHVSSSPHAVQPIMVPTPSQTRMPNSLRPSIQTNAAPVPQAIDARNDSVMKSQFPGNFTVRPLNGNVVILNPQTIPSSSATLPQRCVSTVRITNNLSNAPADSFHARKPDMVPGIVGSPNGIITAGSVTFKTTLPLRSEHAVVRFASNQSRTSEVVSSPETQCIVMVNGVAAEKPALKYTSVVSNSGVPERLPTVNGSQTNGVSDILYVAKEEQTTKMAHQAHEVTISVVENPSKPPTTTTSNNQSQDVLPTDMVVTSSSQKRTAQPSSCENSKVETSMNLNGPFVASAMLRNVAKRQRYNSDEVRLVNGVGSGEQKDAITSDEVSRQKGSVTSQKIPITVINGIRRDLLCQQVEVTANNPDLKTNPLFTSHPVLSTNAIGNHSSSAVVTPGTTNPVLETVPSSGTVVSTHDQNTSAQVVVSNQSALESRVSTSAVFPGSDAPGDNSRDSEVRGEQARGASGLYQCKWSGCSCSFANSKLLYNHAVSAHAPTDQLFTSCQWEGCSNVRRSRASLLFHLRQRHLNLAPSSQVKDPNSLPKSSQASTTLPPNQPSAPSVHGKPVYPQHPSVNPLLVSLKEQLLQTEQESPLTKSVRLTAALILRNIARYSPAGRRKLKRYESSFSEIMCSRVESNVVMAACLHEMTRQRKEEKVETKR